MESHKAIYATIYAGTSKKVKDILKKVEDDKLSEGEINDLTILLNLKGLLLKDQREKGKIINLSDRKRINGEKSIDNC